MRRARIVTIIDVHRLARGRAMAYRRTERVLHRLAVRHAAIIAAAGELAAESGMDAVQIVPVAARAGIAAGTVYRYFPSKTELVAALVAGVAEREVAAIRQAAVMAPGPLSALAAAIIVFAARAVRARRLALAVLAEPAEADPPGLHYRHALVAEFEPRIRAAIAGGHLPDQDPTRAAAAVVGLLIEGLLGPLAPRAAHEGERDAVREIALLALRALGIGDARGRGLVVQTAWPPAE
jgi:AcrR family transcriptional regulator